MKMKILKLSASMLVLIFLMGIMPGMAMAGAPPAVPERPTPVPQAQPSGGSSSYTPPSFQPYTIELHSGDGATIGSLAGIDFSTVRMEATGHSTVNGKNHSVSVFADLGYKPASTTLDIRPGPGGSLLGGMDDAMSLSSVVIAVPDGWSLKSGTSRIRFDIPSVLIADNPGAKCYVVYSDGTNYNFIAAKVTVQDGIATIEAAVPGISGTFTVVTPGSLAPAPTPAPATVPTLISTPAPEPMPTPAPEPSGVTGVVSSLWIGVFGTFAIGEAAGAVILVLFGRFWK
jgi:hypothetical protein